MGKPNDEKKEPIEGQETGKEASEKKDEGKEPTYEELKSTIKDLREKFVPKETVEKLTTELEGVKGKAQVVDKIKEAITGVKPEPTEDERKVAEFYKLLIRDPATAIRQIIKEESAKTRAVEQEEKVEKEFQKFAKRFPEYKDFEDDMKAELLANPGWFGRPNFLQRVFFDVLSTKDPKLLTKLIQENRTLEEDQGFVFEGSSQTDHGSGSLTGKDVMDRMKGAGRTKSFFE